MVGSSSSDVATPDGAEESPETYPAVLADLKQRIRAARLRASLSINKELLVLYWHIGREILTRQTNEGWGTKVVQRLLIDLRTEYPQVKGLSYTNLRYMQRFASAWPEFCQQPAGKNTAGN